MPVRSMVDQSLDLDRKSRTLKVKGLISTAPDAANTISFTNQPFKAAAVLKEGAGAAGAITAQQVCQVLNLDIGAIHLNLLGLVVDLAPISLVITAIQSGGLLGSLLCALAGLLNGPGPLGQIQSLLNQSNQLLSSILAILNL